MFFFFVFSDKNLLSRRRRQLLNHNSQVGTLLSAHYTHTATLTYVYLYCIHTIVSHTVDTLDTRTLTYDRRYEFVLIFHPNSKLKTPPRLPNFYTFVQVGRISGKGDAKIGGKFRIEWILANR